MLFRDLMIIMGFNRVVMRISWGFHGILPSGKLTFRYGKSPFLIGKSTIFMTIFNSKLLVYNINNIYNIFIP